VLEITNNIIILSLGLPELLILLFVIFELFMWRKTGLPFTYRIFLYYMIKEQIKKNYLPKSWGIRSLFWMIKRKSFTVFLMDNYESNDLNNHVSATGNFSHFGIIKYNNIINQIKIKELTDPIQIKRDKKLRDLGL
jgi:hypothetical protein